MGRSRVPSLGMIPFQAAVRHLLTQAGASHAGQTGVAASLGASQPRFSPLAPSPAWTPGNVDGDSLAASFLDRGLHKQVARKGHSADGMGTHRGSLNGVRLAVSHEERDVHTQTATAALFMSANLETASKRQWAGWGQTTEPLCGVSPGMRAARKWELRPGPGQRPHANMGWGLPTAAAAGAISSPARLAQLYQRVLMRLFTHSRADSSADRGPAVSPAWRTRHISHPLEAYVTWFLCRWPMLCGLG